MKNSRNERERAEHAENKWDGRRFDFYLKVDAIRSVETLLQIFTSGRAQLSQFLRFFTLEPVGQGKQGQLMSWQRVN